MVEGEDGGKIGGGGAGKLAESVFDDARNRKKGDLMREEGGDGDLVGGVVNGRGTAAGGHGFPGEAEHREANFVERPEIEREQFPEIKRGIDSRRTGGVEQGMLDGKCHRRRAELGEHRAVGEFDDRVDDALRVHDGGALLGAEAEEALGLDQLEAFVGQRGGVDGDFGAHRPIGMFDGVGGGDGGEAVDGPVAERAAARGDGDAADGGAGVALKTLENGAVFAVDGEKFRAALRGGGEHVLAGENEDLFGSEGEVFAGVKRGEGGFGSTGV